MDNIPVVCFALADLQRVRWPPPVQTVYLDGTDKNQRTCYGKAIVDAYKQFGDGHGLIVLEHDIAADIAQLGDLYDCIQRFPQRVIAVPYVLWPASTGRKLPVWAHRDAKGSEEGGFTLASRAPPARPVAFSLGLTYLPHELLANVVMGEESWDYPQTDTRFSELARRLGIACMTTALPAVHLHF